MKTFIMAEIRQWKSDDRTPEDSRWPGDGMV